MTYEEIAALGQVPILVRGRKTGLIVRWNDQEQEIGVQVPGEEELRWIAAADIVNLAVSGDALATIDALVD